jgi:hypothetical protein
VPTIVVCCALSSDQLKEAVEQGQAWTAGLAELRNLIYVDLPTSHWPMWSKPAELAGILGNAAKQHGQRATESR